MESLEISAKTVDEAVELALEKLGVSRDDVEVEILKESRGGFLGFGGEEATVRVTPRQPQEVMQAALEQARELLEKLLSMMNINASVQAEQTSAEGRSVISMDVVGDDLGILIGRRGQTLSSLQYLVYLMLSHRLKASVPIAIDVEGYRARRREALQNLAWRMAERVTATGQTMTLEPMPPNERRIVHLALRDSDQVTTMSVGEGDERKVTIVQKK